MRKTLYTSASAILLAAGLLGGPAAHADQTTDGSGGVASGNQVNVPVDVKADLCGNSIAVLGISNAQCTKVAEVLWASSDKGKQAQQDAEKEDGGQETDGSGSVAGGNQINIPVDAAVDLCGNSVAVAGVSNAQCTKIVKKIARSEKNKGGGQETDGSGSVAGGNQINVPIDAAVDACGNSIAVLGVSNAQCTKVIKVIEKAPENKQSERGRESNESDAGNKGGGQDTSGSGSVGGGNQVNVPADAAADICGNSVAVLGLSNAQCMKKISSGEKPHPKPTTDPGGKGPQDERKPDATAKPSASPSQDERTASPDPSAAPEADAKKPAGGLPVTGAALGGLVTAAIAAVGGGAAAMYFARKRKSRATEE
ncbi:small secreted domain DUF320 [Murinocardiopsis flavida]|uniref:Small secreted domain DUF320 n=1 Tax=Murinocardiopsis flavida TaxID=645275 RepID=A0A2P8DQG4_9ACTN|nr:chaplin [Murinocardiopsis flavida]PSK99453.1 small secreted domain DUF320 [Murinocardiopsis flavida]